VRTRFPNPRYVRSRGRLLFRRGIARVDGDGEQYLGPNRVLVPKSVNLSGETLDRRIERGSPYGHLPREIERRVREDVVKIRKVSLDPSSG